MTATTPRRLRSIADMSPAELDAHFNPPRYSAVSATVALSSKPATRDDAIAIDAAARMLVGSQDYDSLAAQIIEQQITQLAPAECATHIGAEYPGRHGPRPRSVGRVNRVIYGGLLVLFAVIAAAGLILWLRGWSVLAAVSLI